MASAAACGRRAGSVTSSGDPTATAGGGSEPGPTAAASVVQDQAAAQALAALGTAVRTGDRAGFDAATGSRDGFDAIAGLIWSNLAAITPTSFDWTLTGSAGVLDEARRRRLGEGARLLGTRVSWAVAGDAVPATAAVWATFATDAGHTRLISVVDRPAYATEPSATPLWLLEPIHRGAARRGSVLAAAAIDVAGWSAVLDRAAAAVADLVPRSARPAWNEGLVIEVPGNGDLADRVLGVHPGQASDLAGLTWLEGIESNGAPLRILLRPGLADGLPTLGRDILITHEAVHVATRSPLSTAPLWLIEGYADWVAYARWPEGETGAIQPLLGGPPPTTIPTDQDFATAADPVDAVQRRYATAWTVCRYVAHRYGAARLHALYAAAQDDDLPVALRRVLGTDRTGLERGWRADLDRQLAVARGT